MCRGSSFRARSNSRIACSYSPREKMAAPIVKMSDGDGAVGATADGAGGMGRGGGATGFATTGLEPGLNAAGPYGETTSGGAATRSGGFATGLGRITAAGGRYSEYRRSPASTRI